MSDSDLDSALDIDDEWDDLDRWATEAVKGANDWLVTIRNATDEGIQPWSDQFTGDQGGIMTYAEGLTALALTYEEARHRPGWKTLRPRLYQEDLNYIIDQITAEDGPNLTPRPYLPETLTSDFTDAASFSTSAIADSLDADIEFGDRVAVDDVRSALEINLEWFLDNAIEVDDGSYGWAWVGSTSDAYDAERDEPRNYFTYAVVLPLCDLLARRDEDVIGDVVDGHVDEIRETLEGAKEFLATEYWDGDHWTGPLYAQDVQEEMATCYAIVALSYIDEVADGVDIGDRGRTRMAEGLEYFVNEYERREQNMWLQSETYTTTGEDNTGYVDGSAPYLFIDTIYEILNYHEDLLDRTDYTAERLETLINGSLARVVLARCWAGDKHFRQKGFRHLGMPKTVVTQADGDPQNNPTAIYATGVAIETFYLNFLRGGADLVEPDQPADRSVDAEPVTGEVSGPAVDDDATIQNQYNLSFVIAGDAATRLGDDGEELNRLIKRELEGLFGEDDDGVSGADLATIKAFTERFVEARTSMPAQFGEVFGPFRERLGRDVLTAAKTYADEEIEDELREINIETFLRLLLECYFAEDAAAFREELEYYREQYWNLVLAPQRAAWDRLDGLSDEVIEDFDERTAVVADVLDGFAEDVLDGADPREVGNEFDQRDFGR